MDACIRLTEHAPPPIQHKIIDGLGKLSQEEVNQTVKALQMLTNMLDVQDLDVEKP